MAITVAYGFDISPFFEKVMGIRKEDVCKPG
jgi:uncharacterized protein involved in copper resistance